MAAPNKPSHEHLIAAYEMGELGIIEFTELALEAGMSFDEIWKILESGQDVF